MRKIVLALIFIFVLVILGGIGYLVWDGNGEFLNPKGTNPSALRASPLDRGASIKVTGFLPTWMIGKTIEYTNEIDNLIFLGIEVDEKGNLIWDLQSKKINSETYLKQKDLIWKNGGKNILGIKLFDDEKLDNLLGSQVAKNNLINQLKALRQAQGLGRFDGINVDFEYQSNPVAVLSEKMNSFLIQLKEEDLGEISLDVFVNTINKGSEEQIDKLVSLTDYLIIMAYDFHRPGVDFAGAVAPIGAPIGERSILELVDKITTLGIDKNKIILAYPLYGYEWKTYGSEFGASIKRGWSALASYKRMKDFKNIKWDEVSMTPWVSFEENGEIHQIYFENWESISRKMKLALNNQIGGVGFWALGYEGEDKNFWNLVSGI